MWVYLRYDVWGNETDGWDINGVTRTSFTSLFDGSPMGPPGMPTEAIVRAYYGFDDDVVIQIGDLVPTEIEVLLPDGCPMGRFIWDEDAF